jgi:hypothetical protein
MLAGLFPGKVLEGMPQSEGAVNQILKNLSVFAPHFGVLFGELFNLKFERSCGIKAF